jgi:hypothetical protein
MTFILKWHKIYLIKYVPDSNLHYSSKGKSNGFLTIIMSIQHPPTNRSIPQRCSPDLHLRHYASLWELRLVVRILMY